MSHHICGIILHGGAGAIPENVHQERQTFLEHLAQTYHNRLCQGLSAVDAIVEAVSEIEDSGLFNAGKGSVLNREGEREMDASIMTSDGGFGGIAGVRQVRNPIQLARIVMEESSHLLIFGDGAESFARRWNLLPPFPIPQHRLQEYEHLLKKREQDPTRFHDKDALEGGTVGAVALDLSGRLCAGTSTGGLWLKHKGRVGDTPIIGCGTYATKNYACSVTGYGEGILQVGVARKWCEYAESTSIREATQQVFHECELHHIPCGLIGLSLDGTWVAHFMTKNMSFAYAVGSPSSSRIYTLRP